MDSRTVTFTSEHVSSRRSFTLALHRCGLLLQMWRGLRISVCLCLTPLVTTISWLAMTEASSATSNRY